MYATFFWNKRNYIAPLRQYKKSIYSPLKFTHPYYINNECSLERHMGYELLKGHVKNNETNCVKMIMKHEKIYQKLNFRDSANRGDYYWA